MGWRLFPRIRLRVGIAVMFLLIMVPLTTGMVGALYQQNSQLAYDMAETAMDRATIDVVDNVRGMMGPIARAIDVTVAFGKAQREGLRNPDALRPLMETLEQMPNLYSFYYGLARDGAFLQVVRLSPTIDRFGPEGAKPPADARFVIRRLDASSGQMADSYIYLRKWGDVVGVERGPVRYDPRQRPWYEAALKSQGIATSGVYVFSGTGRPGLTLSRSLKSEDGNLIGTVGADLSLDALAKFLDSRRIGKQGIVFILDEDGRLIGYPDMDKAVFQDGDKVIVVKGQDVANKVVADAVRQYHAGAGQRFRGEFGDRGETYLASFTPFPDDFGKKWVIGAIAAETDFVGPLKRASLTILLVGFGFIILATIGVIVLSRLLTRPIHDLITETERIRHLDLDHDVEIRSGVTEIDGLAAAIARMKNALRSFGAYVPKMLVRNIVESGAGIAVGGVRRPLTVLFSDIKGFTESTQTMPPEDVLDCLSGYFEVVSSAIHQNGGTVDKFIGDAVMALWNAPALDDEHVARACRGMLACREASRTLTRDFAAQGKPPFPTRFGLHTGQAVVGNVGSADRMQYTALGSVVNLASRIEGLNKRYGSELLVTGAVEQAVRDRFVFRQIDLVVPAGINAALPLFELLGEIDPQAPFACPTREQDLCARWNRAFESYLRRQWGAARIGFQAWQDNHPDDIPAKALLALCHDYELNPPPADWDGATHFSDK